MSNLHKMKKGVIPDRVKWFLNLIHENKHYHDVKGKGIWTQSKEEQ